MIELNYKRINSLEEILDIYESPLSFDLETTSLNTHSKEIKIVGMGLTWKPYQAVYLHTYSMLKEELKKELSILENILNDTKVEIWGQNIKYDIRVLDHFGIKVNKIHFDSQIASYSLYNDRFKVSQNSISGHSLDDMSLTWYNQVKIRTKSVIPRKNAKTNPNPHMGQVNADIVAKYCCEDTDTTYRICSELKKEFEKPENLAFKKLFYEIELPVYNHIIDMECNGTYIDIDRIDQLGKQFDKKAESAKDHINNIASQEISITKTDDIAREIFEVLKLHEDPKYLKIKDKLKKTKTGKMSTDKKTLEYFQDHPLVEALLDAKAVQKLKSTYIEGLKKNVDDNWILRTSFNQHITATGRLSSSRPVNLQNIPSRQEEGRALRTAFVSRWRDEGGTFFAPDYSQCELRILAHMSQEPVLIDIFEKGGDAHSACAAALHNIPIEDVTPDLRGPTKTINFGLIYGMTYKKLAADTGMTEDEAQSFIEKYLGKFKKIAEFIEFQKTIAKEYGYTESILGRRRYLPKIYTNKIWVKEAAQREAVNHVIQASNADITKLAMIQIGNWIKENNLKSMMIIQVHDELCFDVHPEEKSFFKDKVLSIMVNIGNQLNLSVPLVCDGEYGENWSEAH